MNYGIVQGTTFLSYTRNAKSITLPNGRSVMGPIKRFPFEAGDYRILPVVEVPSQPTTFQTAGSYGPPVVEGDQIVRYQIAVDLDEEAAAMKLAGLQAEAWMKIQVKREELKLGGTKVLVGGEPKWFHSDADSRIQQLGLTMMADMPAGIMWKTMDGSFVEMTHVMALDIFSARAAGDMEIFAVAEAHKAAMLQVEDPTTYDFSAGWPEVYSE